MRGAALALALLGVAQMAGDLLGLRALAAVAGATAASPAPKVFSAVRGLETFTSGFALEVRSTDGTWSTELTPELNARVRGPYNRRNVYGAALAYGPVLAADPRTQPLFDAISRNALCGSAPLLAELGLLAGGNVEAVTVEVHPRPGVPPPALPLRWTLACP